MDGDRVSWPAPDDADDELVEVLPHQHELLADAPPEPVIDDPPSPDLPLPRPIDGTDDGIDQRFLNRELSWLQFNDRVLSLASEPGIPLLERAKFVAIASTNLDEFFQVRVAALKDTIAAGLDRPTPDGRTPAKQLADIGASMPEFIERLDTAFVDHLVPELAEAGVELVDYDDLTPDEITALDSWFDERVFPVLTPLAVDPGHPFPYISDLALSLAVNVADPETGDRRFARLKVPNVFPRLVEVAVGRFLPVEQLIAAKLDLLFVGMIVEEWAPFRVSRNADLTVEDEEAEDLLEAVEMELRRRRFNRAVRLEVSHDIGAEILELLVRELDLTHDDVTYHRSPLDLSCLWELMSIDRPDLKDDLWAPITAGRLAAAEESDKPIVDVIRHRSMLVHHPYESFSSSVEEFISQAAKDPKVQSIKMTLYRAGGDSAVIRSLIRAAETGKQVAVLVELKARFDEATNVQWAKQLERAGVHVVYGMVGLKTHSKVVLVVRDDGDRLRRYCHIGTGNYNAKTAKIYEDLGLFTCDDDVGADALQLFNHLTGYSRAIEYRTLLVAPRDLRRQLTDLIEHESSFGTDGHITIKCNSIADPEMVEALYKASQAGVTIDLIVRGICCLRPGVPGMSENIRVRSVLGRYLEHSRIFRFAHGNRVGPDSSERIDDATSDALYLIGSADLMPRNLNRRVEVLVPIEHPRHVAWLDQAIEFALADDVVAWEQQPDDTWLRLGPVDEFDPHPQRRMYEWAVEQQTAGRRASE
ncbi:polyphosphate kinase 1 [Ilumatobacter coccineus]|uniref:Polyphosphate kinase n=1 Tax=Ilumatobacter coccineus (strain NBRC 103263 / KCTC 29153 / YM16-304) TaxID=1313172 RepID=A0A6C7E4C4_ILUCY|nr:polyphosphate kinase 1 [Ilumatobacter coccineus]BAN01082.1 polyphosphate kinase [Ilumatobacter coccineus YM16-304]